MQGQLGPRMSPLGKLEGPLPAAALAPAFQGGSSGFLSLLEPPQNGWGCGDCCLVNRGRCQFRADANCDTACLFWQAYLVLGGWASSPQVYWLLSILSLSLSQPRSLNPIDASL